MIRQKDNFTTEMTNVLFDEPTSNPISNFFNQFGRTALIVIIIFIVIPILSSENLAASVNIVLYVCGVLFLLFEGFKTYFQCRKYIYRLSMEGENLSLSYVTFEGRNISETFPKNQVKIMIKEDLFSFNSIGMTFLKLIFEVNGRTHFIQYLSGKWSNEKMKQVAKELKQNQVDCVSVVPIR